jgi:hypothetical protein
VKILSICPNELENLKVNTKGIGKIIIEIEGMTNNYLYKSGLNACWPLRTGVPPRGSSWAMKWLHFSKTPRSTKSVYALLYRSA